MSLQDKASIIWPQGAPSKAGFVAAWNPQTQALVNFPVTRETTKTRINEAGLIESVAANVLPRDFINGGCGDFALEPQRTNLFSDSLGISNTSTLGRRNCVYTLGAGFQGLQSSNLITSTAFTSNYVRCVYIYNAVNGQTNWFSFTIKKKAGFYCQLQAGNATASFDAQIDMSNGAMVGTIPDAANYRIRVLSDSFIISVKTTTIATTSAGLINIEFYNNNTFTAWNSAGGDEFFVSGAQWENQVTYPTSLILTDGQPKTRNADVPVLTGASELLGDSEGALFVEAAVFETSTSKRISLSDGSTTNRILLGLAANSSLLVSNAAGTQADIGGSTLTSNVFIKVLIRYANNNFAIHQGGIEIGTDTSGTTFTDGLLNTIRFASGTGSSAQFYGRIRQLVVFNQSPTSAQANSITTP